MIRDFSAKPVKAVVLTHGHYDHLFGMQVFVREWPQAKIISTQATHDYVEGRYGFYLNYNPDFEITQQQEWVSRATRMLAASRDPENEAWLTRGMQQNAREYYQYARDRVGTRRVLPTVTFTDRYLIDDPETPVEVLFLGRANTHGDAMVWSPRHRVLAAGDAVVSPVPFGSGAYSTDMIETLGRIRGMDFEILVPGHGRPQRDRVHIDRLVTSLQEAKTAVARGIAEGLTLDQIKAQEVEARYTLFGVQDDPWLRYWLKAYWLDDILENFHDEATGKPNEYERDERPQRARTG